VATESTPDLAGPVLASFEAGRGLDHHGGGDSPVAFNPQLDPATPVLIAYTSGTTGQPKGATFTHQSLATNAMVMITALALTPVDEILNVAPMFHVWRTPCARFARLAGWLRVWRSVADTPVPSPRRRAQGPPS
jgi:hypothetical protein